MSIQVLKADGTTETFKVEKLQHSLKRAGANNAEIKKITKQIEEILHNGIRTQEIYRKAFELLRECSTPVRARYSLRRALFDLGPTGFPFEDFLARLFESEGYKTITRIELQGKGAMHELDVAVYNDDESFVVEAKFHSRPGVKSDLQVVLYSYARLLDLQGVKICKESHCAITKLMIVTNTKFTHTAEEYAESVDVDLLSWNYPKGKNLHDRIQNSGLYPITVLQSISLSQKRGLLAQGVITCRDLLKKPHTLNHIHIGSKKKKEVLDEADALVHKRV